MTREEVPGTPGPAPDWRAGIQRLRGAYADSTLRRMEAELRRLGRFCEEIGACPLPASPETLAAAVERYFETCGTHTISTRLWCIRRLHRALDLPDPSRGQAVALAVRRGARAKAGPRNPAGSRQAVPVNAALRDRLIAVAGEGLLGRRNRVLLRMGYDTLCRAAELVALRAEDLERLADGSGRIRLPSARGGAGESVYVTPATFAEIRTWLGLTGIEAGPILRGVKLGRANRRPLTPSTVASLLRQLAVRAGVPPEQARGIGGGSMRVGAVHDLVLAGRSAPQIMRAGRWRSLSGVTAYLREAPVNVWTELEARTAAAPPVGGEAVR